jgi:hypothetical protein
LHRALRCHLVRDGSPVTLPDEHLPADYAPPAFRVHPLKNGAPERDR